MNARDTSLAGLIDYAGLYPPAALDMHAAVRNYLGYRGGGRAAMLGKLIVDIAQLDAFRHAAGDLFHDLPLSVIAPADMDPDAVLRHRDRGFRIECVEVKTHDPAAIGRIRASLPRNVECYFEIPFALEASAALDAVAAAGARAKLRMGGIAPQAFPSSRAVAEMLQALHNRGIAFKATAGLHHPVRSRHRLTYAPDSISALMHGFLNLLTAVSILQAGGSASAAQQALDEQDARAFRISETSFGWSVFAWSTEQVHSIRNTHFISFGSCSFTEPIADLEALGWF